MIGLPVLDSHAPPIPVMALNALGYCHRLFYLEEVEEISLADERVYAGRELHAGLEADEGDECASIDLTCQGLRGSGTFYRCFVAYCFYGINRAISASVFSALWTITTISPKRW